MKKSFLFLFILLGFFCAHSQPVSQRLQKAFAEFEADEQMKHGISSLYVIDAQSGQVVFEKNARIGLAPASTQKTITSVTAFELLGRDFKYRTALWSTDSRISGDTLNGDLLLDASGDPTLGSPRYPGASAKTILEKFAQGIQAKGIRFLNSVMLFNETKSYPAQLVPNGWIWEDIGNYYGAFPGIFNWRENQYDIVLRSGSAVGDPVEIVSPERRFINELKSAPRGTGDNAYVYLPVGSYFPVISGTIPINENAFRISASDDDPLKTFAGEFTEQLKSRGLRLYNGRLETSDPGDESGEPKRERKLLLATHESPSLDSIIYWFNQKSVNFYGEALVRTFAFQKYQFGSADSGLALLKRFWGQKGVDVNELNIYDGSGLSPLNRVTTRAQVHVLKFARAQSWFPAFYASLPEYNGMKMKSGTISDVKGFCGYHKAKNGKEYIFSFLVNNYSGRSSGIVAKMYKVLDHLK